jgi:hypothetical protein
VSHTFLSSLSANHSTSSHAEKAYLITGGIRLGWSIESEEVPEEQNGVVGQLGRVLVVS